MTNNSPHGGRLGVGHDQEAVHERLEGADRIDLDHRDVGAVAGHPGRDALADPAIPGDVGTVGGAVSPPPHWLERAKNVSRVASFLIDPPDGRMPPMTPEAQKAQQDRGAAQAERRS